MSTPPKRIAKYQSIADDLAQAIVNGQYAPGEKLPPHRQMAQRMGVTAGTVARAYAELERQALAQARVGDGTYVRNLDAWQDDAAASQTKPLIDLAHNVPVPTQDMAALRQALADLARPGSDADGLLDYQPEAGMTRHRLAGAHWLAKHGMSGDGARVMLTHGAQHALSAVLRTIARPGDTILTESLSYSGLMALARSMRLQVIGIAMDEHGLLPDALDKAVRSYGSKMLYCTPSLHNPTTATMPLERRAAIAAIVRRHKLLLLEDMVHAAALEQPLPALSSWLPGQSFLMASFSKVMAPGLRVGYLEASPQWLDKVAGSIRADCWMVAPLMPEILTQWLQSGAAQDLIARQRAAIAERLALARCCLQGQAFRSADAMPHIYLPLPSLWPANDFAAALRQAGALVRTMDHFAVGRAALPQAVRISLNAASSIAQLREGLQILVRVLHSRAGDDGQAPLPGQSM